MTKQELKDKIWEKVRYYNDLSTRYSQIADALTAIVLDDDEEELK